VKRRGCVVAKRLGPGYDRNPDSLGREPVGRTAGGLAMSWDIPIGTEFAGYRITGVLGRGGMSVVYAAEHLGLGRTVALKVLAASLAHDESFRERFVRESKLAATLDHPNIIPIYDAGEAEDCLYIAMRHVEGGDLGTLIKKEGPLALGQTIFFVEQVAGALDQAHSQGLVHRDVKPANILIARPSDRVYLTDFGVVKQTATPGLTKTGYFLGTFAYAAPEQIERKPIDGRTDIYALGCMLYECLSGDPPFDAETEASMLHAHLVEPPPKLTKKRPDLPQAINDVIGTAMAKAKEDRYPTAGELVRALRAVALGTTGVRETTRFDAPPPGGPPPAETVLAKPEAPPVGADLSVASGAGGRSVTAPDVLATLAPTPPPDEVDRRAGLRVSPWILALALVLLVAAGSGGAFLATRGGGASGATTTMMTRAPMASTGLAALVPEPIWKNCAVQTVPQPGAIESAVCLAPSSSNQFAPDRLELSSYPSTQALQAAVKTIKRSNPRSAALVQGKGRCTAAQWGGDVPWLHGPREIGGRLFCFFDANHAPVIVWTHERLGAESHADLLGIARASSNDHAALFNWWRFWHHRIGEPTGAMHAMKG
jgi:serine/threonine protein kinase